MFSFYADESGSPDLFNKEQLWYVLLAIGFNDDYWKPIDDAVLELKRRYFPEWNPYDVEIKSNLLRRAAMEKWPPNPFSSLPPLKRENFGSDLYDLIDGARFEWCAAAIDRPAAVAKYGYSKQSQIFEQAYMLLCERLHGMLDAEQNYGRLFIDQQEHNLLAGTKHALIAQGHRNLLLQGSGSQAVDRIIERPYFHDSKYSHHTQIADVLAYNVYRRYAKDDPMYPYFLKSLGKVRGNRRPDGGYYGLKVYP